MRARHEHKKYLRNFSFRRYCIPQNIIFPHLLKHPMVRLLYRRLVTAKLTSAVRAGAQNFQKPLSGRLRHDRILQPAPFAAGCSAPVCLTDVIFFRFFIPLLIKSMAGFVLPVSQFRFQFFKQSFGNRGKDLIFFPS